MTFLVNVRYHGLSQVVTIDSGLVVATVTTTILPPHDDAHPHRHLRKDPNRLFGSFASVSSNDVSKLPSTAPRFASNHFQRQSRKIYKNRRFTCRKNLPVKSTGPKEAAACLKRGLDSTFIKDSLPLKKRGLRAEKIAVDSLLTLAAADEKAETFPTACYPSPTLMTTPTPDRTVSPSPSVSPMEIENTASVAILTTNSSMLCHYPDAVMAARFSTSAACVQRVLPSQFQPATKMGLPRNQPREETPLHLTHWQGNFLKYVPPESSLDLCQHRGPERDAWIQQQRRQYRDMKEQRKKSVDDKNSTPIDRAQKAQDLVQFNLLKMMGVEL
jgi:hypothetical protein